MIILSRTDMVGIYVFVSIRQVAYGFVDLALQVCRHGNQLGIGFGQSLQVFSERTSGLGVYQEGVATIAAEELIQLLD